MLVDITADKLFVYCREDRKGGLMKELAVTEYLNQRVLTTHQLKETQIFNFNGNEVRTVVIDGEPWFVGKDITNVLGYTNASKALRDHVDEEDKLNNESLSSLGQRGGWIVNESGLYSLVLSSKLPTAKAFKRWVTSEVLPTLRKTGRYRMPKSFSEALHAYAAQVELTEQLQIENKIKDQQINEMKPKISYVDNILQCPDTVLTTQIAKDYGMAAKTLNSMLHEYGIQYKAGGQWLLYSKYQKEGYTQSDTTYKEDSSGKSHAYISTKWTQKGRLFIYEQLKRRNVLPLIERDKDGN